MTEYKETVSEAKENTPKLPGPTGYTQGALILIIQELRRMNDNLERIAKRIQSDVI